MSIYPTNFYNIILYCCMDLLYYLHGDNLSSCTVNCFKQSKQLERFYDLYHKLYLDIWDNYDNLAIHMGYYDDSIKSHEESLLRLNEIVFDIAKIGQNDLVLDAGSGVGGSSIWLGKLKGCKVIGISLAKKEIKLARKFSKQNKVNNFVR